MSPSIAFSGNIYYILHGDSITLNYTHINNTSKHRSGQILIKLYNTQQPRLDRRGYLTEVGGFTLEALGGRDSYNHLEKTIKLHERLKYPYLNVTVSQRINGRFCDSDVRGLAELPNRQKTEQKRSYSTHQTNNTKHTHHKWRSNKSSSFGLTEVKKRVKGVAKVAGLVGAVGGLIFPPIAPLGLIGGAIDALLSD